jgi:hypothetical protein
VHDEFVIDKNINNINGNCCPKGKIINASSTLRFKRAA